MVRFAIVGLIAVLSTLAFVTSTAVAWECQAGVPDTQQNEEAGLCVLVTPTPSPTKTPLPTFTPVTTAAATSTTTATSSTTPTLGQPALFSVPSASASPAVAPSNSPSGSSTGAGSEKSQHFVEVCVYQPSTQMWELRHVPSGNAVVEQQGGHWPASPGICAQDTSLPTPTIPVVLTVITIERAPAVTATATLEETPIPTSPPAEEVKPPAPPPAEVVPPAEEETPEATPIPVPVQIP